MLWIITFHAVNGSKVFGDMDARVAVPFLTFSMPWFFYKSGMFFKGSGNGLGRDVRKLLLPYLKWTAAGFAVYLLMMAIDGTFTFNDCLLKPLDTLWIYGYIPLDVPLWFVLSLFAVKALARCTARLKIHPAAVAAIGFAVAFGLHIADNPRIPVWLANIPMGLGFFFLGHLLSRHEGKAWIFIPCTIGYIAFIMSDTPVVGLHRNVHLGGNYYLWPLFSICGIVAFNNLCRWIGLALERTGLKKFRPVSFIGRNSILLLVSHAFVYFPILHYSTMPPVKTFLLIESIYFIVLIPVIAVVCHRKRDGAGLIS